jgi:hypothetical protein
MTVWKSTEGLGVTEAGIKVFEDIVWEQAASSNN